MIKKFSKITLYGFLSWLIPFIASLFFFSKDGLVVDKFLFKSIMISVGSISASFLLILYFKDVKTKYFKEGIIIGFSWYAINVLFDFLILIPMSKMSVADYVMQIAIVYSVIIAMSVTVGASLQLRKR